MKIRTDIGGYFESESCLNNESIEIEFPLFNSGRSSFAYLLISNKISHVYLPKYTCDSILEPLRTLKISYSFYSIETDLIPSNYTLQRIYQTMVPSSIIVLNNYFGILDNALKNIQLKRNTVVDNSQAFYSNITGELGSFNSFRKFFGIGDGSSIRSKPLAIETNNFKQFNSEKAQIHLNGRKAEGPFPYYQSFLNYENEFQFDEIKLISNRSKEIYSRLDHVKIKSRRRDNFQFLNKGLNKRNQLNLLLKNEVPMVYPLLIENGDALKKYLIEHKVFVSTYWNNNEIHQDPGSFEQFLIKNLVTLPIDQRYTSKEMGIILKLIDEF